MTGISRGGNKFISSFVLSAGFVTVFFGLLVLLGRVTGISSLIMLFPNTAPIQFNTALAIAFSGVALILAQRGHRKHSAFFGGLVAAIGAVTIVEYFLGTFSGIDQFFVRPFLSAASPYPGRMAPDTALCFFSIGSAVLILNSRVISRFSGLFASIFGLVVIFVSGMAIRSHLLSASAAVSDLHTAYTWGSHNRMTVQGAVQILIAGLALLAHLLERDHRQYGKTETFVPLGSSALCLFAAMLIWQGLMKVDIENIHALTTSQAGGVVRLIEHSLEERLLGVQRLGRRWDYSGKPPKNQWIDDVSHYYQDFPGFQALSWADSQYHVQWVYPLAGNEKVIGFNFHTGAERIEAIDEGLKTRHSVVTKVITLKQGGEGFGILTPLFPRGKFDGFIGAGFRITDLVGKLINPEGYELYIRDANHSIYASGNIDAQYRRELSAEVPLNFHEMKWTVEMVPTPATLQRQGSNLALTVFLVGLIASMLIGTIARLSIISGSSKRRAWAALEWRRAIMDSTSQMIIATNAQGTIVTFNPAAEKGLGYVAEELIGKETPLIFRDPDEVQNRFDLIHSQSGKAPKSAFEALVEKARKGVIEEQEATFVRKDGRKFPVALTVTALHGANHAITGYLGVAVDITEKRQVRIALEKAKEEALESARAKAAFLANMSHEIRTPLNGIIGMADLLMETPLEDQQRKFAKIIQDSGSNLLTIINDILDFSKVEAGKMSLECVDFRLTAVIEGQVDLLATRAREKEISLMTYIDPKISAFVKGDPGRIGQVLLNLLGNAIKFTQEGSVTVNAHLVESRLGKSLPGEPYDNKVVIRFSVMDTGIGMAPSVTKTLFQPFVQADGSTARKYGGTGLGLSICKRLVELMGGEVGVNSEEGKGSEFWFTCMLDQSQMKSEEPSPGRHPLGGLRVLVVDDDPASAEVIYRYLKNWNFRPFVAYNGSDALALLKREAAASEPMDLVIIDKRMPGMDGFVLADKIKNDPLIASTPLILATAFDRSSQLDNAMAHGFSAYLTKPLKQSELYDSIASAMKGHRERMSSSESHGLKGPEMVSKSESESTPSQGRRILVAEDNSVNQLLILTMLKKLGYSAIAVANGREVLDALARAPFDLVLMDCQMPELDGFNASLEIRKREKKTGQHIPIVALTANAMKEDKDKCLASGMDDYLSKPVKKEILGHVLEKWLSKESTAKTA